MQQTESKLVIYRSIVFPVIALLELGLSVLFLVLDFYEVDGSGSKVGYTVFFSWILVAIGLIVVVSALLLTFSGLKFGKEKQALIKSKGQTILSYLIVVALFVQMVAISITLFFYSPLFENQTPIFLVLIISSLFPPLVLYYQANFIEQEMFALSKEAPLRIKLAASWLLFLVGFTQIFASYWEFLTVALIILGCAYLFYFLNSSAAILTPLVLLIHGIFFGIASIIALIQYELLTSSFAAAGIEATPTSVILIAIFIFLVPAIISLVLSQSFFRKRIIAWIRDARTKDDSDMEIVIEK